AVNDGGLRINATSNTDRDFGVEVVSAPTAGDQIVETDGARVFLEENAAVVLDNKVLDATVSETGAVTFALLPQV
ncbi:MAG: Fe-S cluster assembly protein HesB, partial [Microbacteriaceae bacterium]|nr:Fe-S cluster assembly protein HesB [Microbacteriaceae bacterium]